MDLHTMNRRKLCKAMAAIALAALSSPLKQLAAAEPVAMPVAGKRAGNTQKDEQKFFMCILRRQSPGECVTFWKKRKGIEGTPGDGI
jgi:hypothetical protein